MMNSRIISTVIEIWHFILLSYEKSFIAGVINRICNFFKTRAEDSVFVNIFKKGFCTGSWWQNSIVYKLFAFVLKGGILKIENNGLIAETIINIFDISLRSIGKILLGYTVGMVIGLLVTGGLGIIDTAVCIAFASVGIICLIINTSIRSAYIGSRIIKFFGGLFYGPEIKEKEITEIKSLYPFIGAMVFGVLAGVSNPVLYSAAVIAIFCAVAVVARYEIGVYAVLFLAAYLPTALIAGLCVITIVGFIYALIGGRVKEIKLSVLAPGILLYVLFGMFSTFASFEPISSAFVFVVYLVFILEYFVMVNTFNTPEKFKGAVACFASSVLFIALIGIWQNFNVSETTSGWVDTEMFENIKTRVYATFENPNVLGQYFIISLPMVFALFCAEKKPVYKFSWLCVFAVGFLCLIYTWSRGAWVGVLLALAVYLLIRDRRWIVLCVLMLCIMPFVLPESILNRIMSIGNSGDSSTAYRISVWIASLRVAVRYWMLGAGYGSDAFSIGYKMFALPGADFALHSHNFYIQLVTDIGIAGLIAFLLILFNALGSSTTLKNKEIKTITLSGVGVVIGYMFQGIAESLWYNMRMSLMFWILMAFIISGVKIDKAVEHND